MFTRKSRNWSCYSFSTSGIQCVKCRSLLRKEIDLRTIRASRWKYLHVVNFLYYPQKFTPHKKLIRSKHQLEDVEWTQLFSNWEKSVLCKYFSHRSYIENTRVETVTYVNYTVTDPQTLINHVKCFMNNYNRAWITFPLMGTFGAALFRVRKLIRKKLQILRSPYPWRRLKMRNSLSIQIIREIMYCRFVKSSFWVIGTLILKLFLKKRKKQIRENWKPRCRYTHDDD